MQQLHILTHVPDHIIDTPHNIVGQQRWQRRYNVAGWIRFDARNNSPVRLMLRFKDASGVREQLVDQGTVDSKTLLLSGVAHLRLTGRIERMELLLQCDVSRFTIDELFVQPVKDTAGGQSKSQRLS